MEREFRLERTSAADPEAYNVFREGFCVARFWLRYGHFVAIAGERAVYESHPQGQSTFTDEERHHHLQAACHALKRAMDPPTTGMEPRLYEVA